jgi:16S rRNA (cytidine1402-2'-O)-methyltransferase
MHKSSATLPSTLPGKLYVIATPIGNLQDITQRAILTLQSVDAIYAEDTRHSGSLLAMLGIQKPLYSLHSHNEHEKTDAIIHAMQAGQSFALISDAGTPLIRDPGFSLVRQAQLAQIPVVPIPGACALITALSAAGVPCDTFTFAGFLPAKKPARIEQLSALRAQGHTVIFYESTHRLAACLKDIVTVYGEAFLWVLAKELTKIHEQFISGTTADIQAWLSADKNRTKGEFVLLLPPVAAEETPQEDVQLLTVLLRELPLKQAVKIAAELSSTKKNSLYELALTLMN